MIRNHRPFYVSAVLIILTGLASAFVQFSNLTLFEQLSSKKTGITFNNRLTEDKKNNILTYEYFYNGGGVAVGDINNDGLDDIYFTANMAENKLYLNLGDFKFKDITASSGVKGKSSWTTGVAMADVNGDGLLDIYICYSGNGDINSRKNQLFINKGGLTFEEQAELYGLDDPSNSTQALFFDYDNDGDLDMYLLNHHIEVINEVEFDKTRKVRHPMAGDKLFRNDDGKFTDVSEKAGIKGHALGFGLGVTASDLNGDGWIDIYVSNDYIEPDYIYINNGDGTFSDQMSLMLQHISHFSMGLDIADINNDCLPDIFTLDMLPEDNKRQKLLYGPENYEHYALMVNKGFYHQNMRNMLQLNHGNGLFSEIGQLAGISNTDWSWSALFFDVTNSGHKDLFISNGYYRDYTNRDFLKYKGDYYFKSAIAGKTADTLHLVTTMTSTPIPNYIFENGKNLVFEDKSKAWGISNPNFSAGAAYGDFNNDGKMDLVVNNLNDQAFVYRNRYGEKGDQTNNYLSIKLIGPKGNTSGIGSKVTVFFENQSQYLEQMPTRGFQSTVSHTLHVGLGVVGKVDSIAVVWPGGKRQVLRNIAANQLIKIEHQFSESQVKDPVAPNTIFRRSIVNGIQKQSEYGFNDFKRQPLLIEMPSYIAPAMATADVDGDGVQELFVGGSKGSPGKLYKLNNEQWQPMSNFQSDQEYTDACAVFFDANGDGWPDLYISSGGFHDYLSNDESLQDRLYLNDTKGNLQLAPKALPKIHTSTSTVKVIDINKDGHPDLFVGGRIMPGKYPSTPKSYVLINDGQGNYADKSEEILPEKGYLGMVTAATTMDLNNDGYEDLILVGEYMTITALQNQQGKSFTDVSKQWFGDALNGWWSSIGIADFDGDGDLDLIVGNFGLNSTFRPTQSQPLTLYFGDFDENSTIDPVLVSYVQGKPFPFASRDEITDQMYSLRSKFPDYATYAQANVEQVIGPQQLKNTDKLIAYELRSFYFENTPEGFIGKPLPIEAQFAPIHAIFPLDYDQDGHMDFIIGGNQTYTRLRLGVIDANYGQLFKGNGKGNFNLVPQRVSGFQIKGDVKTIISHPTEPDTYLFGINNQEVISYKKR
jgi:enediyne biosynthesis protein E4